MRLSSRLLLAASILCLAVVGWFVVRDFELSASTCNHDVQAWMRHEFALDDAAMARIASLQERFEKECAEHCRLVSEAKSAMDAKPGPDSRARLAGAREKCRLARVDHVRAIAACMSPESAKAYLALILPRIDSADHEGATDISGQTHSR
jgi:hypothetical protein